MKKKRKKQIKIKKKPLQENQKKILKKEIKK